MADHPSSQDLYRRHQAAIERAITHVCSRRHLSDEEAEEFSSEARLKILENDAAVLREFRGDSSMSTYLVVVLKRFLEDWRRAKWGKWRPSAQARREGTVATYLEQLVYRDRIPFEQAAEILRLNHNVRLSVPELAEILGRLPVRTGRHMESDDVLERMPEPRADPETAALRREDAGRLARAVALLHRALDRLAPEDRLILRLRFHEGRKVVDIAHALRLQQKPLYRRIDKIRTRLRRDLIAHDLDEGTVRRVLRRKSDGEDVY